MAVISDITSQDDTIYIDKAGTDSQLTWQRKDDADILLIVGSVCCLLITADNYQNDPAWNEVQ